MGRTGFQLVEQSDNEVEALEAGKGTPFDLQASYLNVFSPEEVEELADQLGKQPQELNDILSTYACWYRFFLLDNLFAIGMAIPITSYQILRGRDGAQAIAKLIHPDAVLSDTLALSLSTPLALFDLTYHFATVSPKQEAVKRTLHHALDDTYEERVNDWLALRHDDPSKARCQILSWVFNQSVQYTYNLLYASTAILGFYQSVQCTLPFVGELTLPAPLPLLPWGAQVGIIAGTAYAGSRFCSLISKPDYLVNFHHFFLSNEGPWLIGEVSRGHFSTPLQIVLRGLGSTILTRAYPRFYVIAEEVFGQLLGVDADTSATLAVCTTILVGWQVFCSEYPKSYRRNLSDRLQIEMILKKRLTTQLDAGFNMLIEAQTNSLRLALSPIEIKAQKEALKNQLLHQFVKTNYALCQAQVLEGQDPYFIFQKEPGLRRQLLLQSFLTFCLGAYLDLPVTLALCILLTYTFYQSEKERVIDHLILQKLLGEADEKSEAPSLSASVLMVTSNLSRGLAALGAGKAIFGEKNRIALAGTAFFIAENVIETLRLTYTKTKNTINRWVCCRKKQVSLPQTPATLFASPQTFASTDTLARPSATSNKSSGTYRLTRK